jgi:uncharacterized membrane protein
MKWYLTVGFTILVTVATLLIRIPIAGGGYFNFGDVVVMFVGMYAGSKMGAIAGGVGSALADLIGFPIFAPITLVVKGVEGFVCGLAHGRKGFLTLLFPILAGLVLITGYFLGTLLIPQLGKAAAISDLPGNVLQAVFGIIGGRILFEAAKRLGI